MALNPEYISPLIIALIALLCSAFFSGMEIAFVSSNKVRAEIEMSRGGIINGLLNIFYGNREMFISTLLIGNNIANIVYSMAMARLLTIPLQQWVRSAENPSTRELSTCVRPLSTLGGDLMSIGLIALLIMIALGLFMTIAPEKAVRADMRDDPAAIDKVKKAGGAILGFGGMAALLMLKYTLF